MANFLAAEDLIKPPLEARIVVFQGSPGPLVPIALASSFKVKILISSNPAEQLSVLKSKRDDSAEVEPTF